MSATRPPTPRSRASGVHATRRAAAALLALVPSHPLTEDRIRDVEAHVASLDPGRLAGLRRDSPASPGLREALAAHPPPPEKYRVDEERRTDGDAGAATIPDRTGVCAAR